MLEGTSQGRAASSLNVFLTEPFLEAAADVTELFSRRLCAPGLLHKELFEMQRGQRVCPALGVLSITFRHLADTDWTEQPLATFMVQT